MVQSPTRKDFQAYADRLARGDNVAYSAGSAPATAASNTRLLAAVGACGRLETLVRLAGPSRVTSPRIPWSIAVDRSVVS